MNIWILIIIVLLILIVFVTYYGNKESNKAGQEAAIILSRIEEKYGEFVERKIRNRILTYSNFDLNQDKIIEEAIILLKPDIEGLISHINATTYSRPKTTYEAKYFSNIPHLTNEMFIKSTKSKNDSLSEKDEQDIFEGFKDGMKADLLHRITELKDGEFSS